VGDRERQNRAFIRDSALLDGQGGQGETPDCGQIAVKICARKRNFPRGIERGPERESPGRHRSPMLYHQARS